MRIRLQNAILAGIALSLAACGGDNGLSGPLRVTVTGLNFPTGLLAPRPMQPVRAFTELSFALPLFLTSPRDGTDRVAVAEKAGTIRIFPNDPGVARSTLFLDITDRVVDGGEQGLLGLAFHPDYATKGRFYVYYTASSPRRSVLSRYTVSSDPDVADRESEEILLTFSQPAGNHNGGMIAFGPDGRLCVATGDGGGSDDQFGNAQDKTTLLGKILRHDDDGTAPGDNPLFGEGNGVRDEIWAYGLRNPWRFSFDPDTVGIAADHGPGVASRRATEGEARSGSTCARPIGPSCRRSAANSSTRRART